MSTLKYTACVEYDTTVLEFSELFAGIYNATKNEKWADKLKCKIDINNRSIKIDAPIQKAVDSFKALSIDHGVVDEDVVRYMFYSEDIGLKQFLIHTTTVKSFEIELLLYILSQTLARKNNDLQSWPETILEFMFDDKVSRKMSMREAEVYISKLDKTKEISVAMYAYCKKGD